MKLVVCLSYGVSVADWQRQGILERETAMYRNRPGLVLLLASDLTHSAWRMARSVEPLRILGRPSWCPVSLYSLIGPATHWKALWGLDEIRSHNGPGVWTAVIARLLFGGRLVARFGFIWSWDMVRRGVPLWKVLPVLVGEWLACRLEARIEVSAQTQAAYLRAVHGVV